jgi:hypothetical protein
VSGRLVALFLLAPLGGAAAHAQSAPDRSAAQADSASASTTAGWHGALSLANLFDGNVSHDVIPVRSYGVVPAATVTYESVGDTGLGFGYEVAANSYTGTDEWDRISHSLYTTVERRIGKRMRLETGGEASWRGSSEDRELANVFGVSQRLAYRLSATTRVALTGVYRYKQYTDDPSTSGLSPSIGAKIDRRLPGDRRFSFSYRYQTRLSEAPRNRYRRSVYAIELSTPLIAADDRLSIEFEYRPQLYGQRVIKVAGAQMLRADRRLTLGAVYRRPVSERVDANWTCGLESRRSNDPTKAFFAPTFGMTMSYRLR